MERDRRRKLLRSRRDVPPQLSVENGLRSTRPVFCITRIEHNAVELARGGNKYIKFYSRRHLRSGVLLTYSLFSRPLGAWLGSVAIRSRVSRPSVLLPVRRGVDCIIIN
jgi:hypothetical protein